MRSQLARSMQQARNAGPGRKKDFRSRISPETLLTWIAQDPELDAKVRLEAAKTLARIRGLLKEPDEERKAPAPVATREPVRWS